MFGELVRAHRRRLGLTQEEVADRIGIGIRTVRDIEAGRVDHPRPATVRLLAGAFGLAGGERDRFHQAAWPGGTGPADPTGAAGPAGSPRTVRSGPDGGADGAAAVAGIGSGRPAGRTELSAVTPAQLPVDVAGFAGRSAELGRLSALLDTADGPAAPVVISAIAGTAGVGKTALAVHWAHQVADRFPDGQLYVNLRGYAPGQDPTSPAEALRGFLDALQVPTDRIPAGLDAQAALYRSLLAGRRMLIVLDNARDADQVRQLLPGSRGCLALITSRDQLTGLLTSSGAQLVALAEMSTVDAERVLAARLGADRVAAEAAAVDEIIVRCARLPLALAIVAARADTRPDPALAHLAAELAAARDRLDALGGDDPSTDLRTVFSWSYRALGPAAARLFRLLGLHPGPDLAAPAAASLAGAPVGQVQQALAELTRTHLVTEHRPGRYSWHDLLGAYAAELAHEHDSADQRRAAVQRLLDHYLHTTHAAARLLQPLRDPIGLPPADPSVTVTELADLAGATGWFTAERPALLAAVGRAADAAHDGHAWRLAWTLDSFLDRGGHWPDLLASWRRALLAGQRLADPAVEALAHRSVAHAATRLGRYDDAEIHFHQALAGYERLADHAHRAHTNLNLAWLCDEQGRSQACLDHLQRALDGYRTAGHRAGESHALNNLGWTYGQLGDHEQALVMCTQALALAEEIDDRYGQANIWDSLGSSHHHLGRYDQALACYQRGLELQREIGDRYEVASTLGRLGDTQEAAGEAEAARQSHEEALDILDDLGHPDAEQLRAKLKATWGADGVASHR